MLKLEVIAAYTHVCLGVISADTAELVSINVCSESVG